MRQKAISGMITTLLLAPLLLSLAAINMTVAPTTSNVMIYPCVSWNPELEINSTFTVDYYVDYVYKLAAYQIELGEADFEIPGWDTDVLHLMSVENGPFLESAGGTAWFSAGPIDNELGTLGLSIGVLSPQRRFPTGGGVLCTMTFEIVGDGCTAIEFGKDSGILDYMGRWVVRGTINPDQLHDGFYHTPVPGPQLEFPHGVSGIWEKHQVILVGQTQTSYAMVRNRGEMGAWVEVKFVVIGPDGVAGYLSNQAWVPAMTKVGEVKIPGEVVVSVDYIPGLPGRYRVYAVLYFKAGCMEEKFPYSCVEETLGGEGTTKPTNVAFIVKTHL